MTEQETIKVLTFIVMSYPASEKFKDEVTIKGMVAVWKNIFKDDDARLVETAVQMHVAVNKWPPSIAEIRDQMVTLQRPDIIPPDVAWAAVEDLLVTTGEFETPNLYAALPKSIARVVEIIGWHKLYNLHCGQYRGEKEGLDRVAFMDLYKPAYARERNEAMLPARLQSIVGKKRESVAGESLRLIEATHEKRVDMENFIKQLHGLTGGTEQ